MYAGDFPTAATTAQALIKEDPKVDVPYLPLAMEALSANDVARARTIYQQAAGAGETGASLSAMGLADIEMFEGKYADAIAQLPAAAKRDQDQGNSLGAVAKLVALAEAHAARNEAAPRQDAIGRARALSNQDNVLVPAARLAVAAGRLDEARAIAKDLAGRLPAQSRAYARLIEAEIAMSERKYPAAIDALNAAQKQADLWLVRFALGRAYFERGDYTGGRLRIREMPAAPRRSDRALPRRPPDLPLLRDPALLAGTRPRNAEARRPPAVPGVPEDPPGRDRRSARRGCPPPARSQPSLKHRPGSALPEHSVPLPVQGAPRQSPSR